MFFSIAQLRTNLPYTVCLSGSFLNIFVYSLWFLLLNRLMKSIELPLPKTYLHMMSWKLTTSNGATIGNLHSNKGGGVGKIKRMTTQTRYSPLQVHWRDHHLSCLYQFQLLQRLRIHSFWEGRGWPWIILCLCVFIGIVYVRLWQRNSVLPHRQTGSHHAGTPIDSRSKWN